MTSSSKSETISVVPGVSVSSLSAGSLDSRNAESSSQSRMQKCRMQQPKQKLVPAPHWSPLQQECLSLGELPNSRNKCSGASCANNEDWEVEVKVAQSCPTLCLPMNCSPWNSPGQNTGVGSLSLLQGIFPTLGSNPGLLPCR